MATAKPKTLYSMFANSVIEFSKVIGALSIILGALYYVTDATDIRFITKSEFNSYKLEHNSQYQDHINDFWELKYEVYQLKQKLGELSPEEKSQMCGLAGELGKYNETCPNHIFRFPHSSN